MAQRKRPKRRSRPGRGGAARPKRAITRAKRSAASARPRRPAPRSGPRARPRPRAAVTHWANAIGCVKTHLDYTTHSVEDMKAFYGGTLGFTNTTFDPNFEYLVVKTGPGSSLGFMPPMP